MPMKKITTALMLTVGLSAFTVLGRPAPEAAPGTLPSPDAQQPKMRDHGTDNRSLEAAHSFTPYRRANAAQNLRGPRDSQWSKRQFTPGRRVFGVATIMPPTLQLAPCTAVTAAHP